MGFYERLWNHAWSHGLNACVPPNSYVEILIPTVMILRGGAFGRRLDHKISALISGTTALTEDTPERAHLPLLPCGGTMSQKLPSQQTGPH
jgi:hypothetical protein